MKRILVYMLLLGCFACSDEVLLDSEEVVRVKSEVIIDDPTYELIKSKFVFVEWVYAPNLRALTKIEQNDFLYKALFVFKKNPVLKQLLKDFPGGISVAMDPTLPSSKGARYVPGLRLSAFGSISHRSILHEFFHNFQHQKLGYSMDEYRKGMIELEAYMAMDIIHVIEYRAVPDHLEARLGSGQEAYRAMLSALANRKNVSAVDFMTQFNEWAKTWDNPDGDNISQHFTPALIMSILEWYTRLKRIGKLQQIINLAS